MILKKHIIGTKLAMTSLTVLALAAGSTVARAAINLTFEGLQTYEPIENYYDGGFGGLGSGPGPNYGITFSANSLAIIADSAGGGGNFENNPSGDTIAFFLIGTADTMNLAAGFTTGFSFYYSSFSVASTGSPGSVTVWSGLNGTGTELADLTLLDTGNNGPAGAQYNMWVPIGVTFAGTAESVDFGGSANYIGFDNITIGSATATGSVPDNTGASIYVLAALGLAGAAWASRKQGIATV
jgi:hypothetical protein